MIHDLELTNVGINKGTVKLEFGERINIFTGDNGLGKSFLLDIIWWSLTRTWPNQINSKLESGYIAKPFSTGEAKIKFTAEGKTGKKKYQSQYERLDETWLGKSGRPINPGLVIYLMADNSLALWDPFRNYWKQEKNADIANKVPAYIYTQKEVWNGYESDDKRMVFNGLLRDWVLWQTGNSKEFKHLQEVLKILSPNANEVLKIGELTRISLDDERLLPTIKMPYGKDVLLQHTSSALKKIITLAYFLVYSWQKHLENAKLLEEEPTKQITFIIDEIEAHLHPKWQQCIVPTILSIMKDLNSRAQIQLFTATHSPLIMASLEPEFDDKLDRWFDLDLVNGEIQLESRVFEKQGEANNWLQSEAFDLKSSRAPEIQKIIDKAQALFDPNNQITPTSEQLREIKEDLLKHLSSEDDFWTTWRLMCERKGWK